MTKLKQFLSSNDKSTYLMDPYLDWALYRQISTLPDMKVISKELVDNLEKNQLEQLIIRLTDLCFKQWGAGFLMRYDYEPDFLADILIELAKKSGDDFAFHVFEQRKHSHITNYPEGYKLNKEFGSYLYLIKMVVEKCKGDIDEDILAIEQQLVNVSFARKIFNKLLYSVNPLLSADLDYYLNAHMKDVSQYLEDRIPTEGSPEAIESYFQNKQWSLENKQFVHENAIENIKLLILNHPWEIGVNFCGLFQIGGEYTSIDGHSVKVPHRIAEIAGLIKDYEKLSSGKSGKKIYELYEAIQDKAQEALDAPRCGQKESTRTIYQGILNNVYRTENKIEKPCSEEARLINS